MCKLLWDRNACTATVPSCRCYWPFSAVPVRCDGSGGAVLGGEPREGEREREREWEPHDLVFPACPAPSAPSPFLSAPHSPPTPAASSLLSPPSPRLLPPLAQTHARFCERERSRSRLPCSRENDLFSCKNSYPMRGLVPAPCGVAYIRRCSSAVACATPALIHFIESCLRYEPAHRTSAATALNHAAFAEGSAPRATPPHELTAIKAETSRLHGILGGGGGGARGSIGAASAAIAAAAAAAAAGGAAAAAGGRAGVSQAAAAGIAVGGTGSAAHIDAGKGGSRLGSGGGGGGRGIIRGRQGENGMGLLDRSGGGGGGGLLGSEKESSSAMVARPSLEAASFSFTSAVGVSRRGGAAVAAGLMLAPPAREERPSATKRRKLHGARGDGAGGGGGAVVVEVDVDAKESSPPSGGGGGGGGHIGRGRGEPSPPWNPIVLFG